MAGVVFIFVREDASDVEALAEAFERAGYAIADAADDALNVVVWSRAAMRCNAFRTATDRAARSGRVVVANLIAAPPQEFAIGAPVVDISAWDGRDDAGLDPLFYAVLDIIHPARINVIALPGPTLLAEAPLRLTYATSEPVSRARAAWDAPIPTTMLRPVQEEARIEAEPQPKLGAPSPRRDFRRMRTQSHGRAHAALAFAVVALIAGAGFALNAPATTPAPRAHMYVTPQGGTGGVSLDSASADAIGLVDATPVEQTRLFEPGQQVGHRGREPPSARSVRPQSVG